MPIYNDAQCLPRALESVRAQRFDRERLFVVMVDGNSTDASADIARSWLEDSQRHGVLLSNARRAIPISLNYALRYAAPNDFIMRMDSHSVWGPTYLTEAARALEETPETVACVGCEAYPMPAATFQKRVVEALFTNRMGLGSDHSPSPHAREADSVYLGAWRASVVRLLSGYNETMRANEDAEMAARARRLGYRVLRMPLPCRFIVKRGMLATIAQWARYGFWRAKTLQRHPDCMRLRHLACPLALIGIVALLFSPLRALLAALFLIYALFVVWKRCAQEPWPVTLAAILFFPLVHLAYATGLFAGVLSRRVSAWPPSEALFATGPA